MIEIPVPSYGIGEIKLYENYKDVITELDNKKLKYSVEMQDNNDCTVGYNWLIVNIGNAISLYFSKGNYKLFKISVKNNKDIALSNGIYVGMKLEYALSKDPKLIFDEWNEIYESDEMYYLEDSLDSGEVVSLNIFVKELNDEDFDECKW